MSRKPERCGEPREVRDYAGRRIPKRGEDQYASPNMEIEAALIGAIVGGIFGFAAASLRSWLDRRYRKRALATALLLELRSIKYLIRRYFNDPDNLTGDFQSAHFDRLDATVFELDEEAARLALILKYRLDEIRLLRRRQMEKLGSARRDRLKVKLYAAACEVPKLKAALIASQGSEPQPMKYEELKADSLTLPGKTFDYGPDEEGDR